MTTAATDVRIEQVPLDRIQVNPRNIRRELRDLGELTASIKQVGVLEPIVLAPATDSTDYDGLIIAGHRRVAAAKKAGLKTVPARWREDLQGPIEQIATMLVENLQRDGISPVEEAKAYEQLLAFDLSVATIAKRTGRSQDTIRQRLQLTGLPEKIQDQLHVQRITLTDATTLIEWADEPEHDQLEKAIGSVRWEQTLAEASRARARRVKAAASRAKLLKLGVKILDKPPVLYDPKERTKSLGDWDLRHPHTRAAMTVEEHVKCKGHAAYVDSMGDAVYVCTDAAKFHKDRVGAPRSTPPPAARSKEQIAADREQARVAEVLGAAGEVRRQLLQEVIAGTRKAPTGLVGLFLGIEIVDGYGEGDAVAEALGWVPPQSVIDAPEDTASEAWNGWFLEQCAKAKPDVVARMAAKLLLDAYSGHGFSPTASRWTHPITKAVFDALVRAGYTPVDEELAKFAPVPAE